MTPPKLNELHLAFDEFVDKLATIHHTDDCKQGWQISESPIRLEAEIAIPGDSVVQISAENLDRLIHTYRNALDGKVTLEDDSVLKIDADTTQEMLDAFYREVEGAHCLYLHVAIDKMKLLEQFAVSETSNQLVLFFSHEQFDKLLSTWNLRNVESFLFSKQYAMRTVILLPDTDIDARGEYLALLGGQYLTKESLTGIMHAPSVETQDLARKMPDSARKRLDFPHQSPQFLTPLHLYLRPTVVNSASILGRLYYHFTNIFLLYTAARTIKRQSISDEGDDGNFSSSYVGAKQSVEIQWRSAGSANQISETDIESATHLYNIVTDCYQNEQAVTMLPLMQTIVAFNVGHIRSKQSRLKELLARSAVVESELQFNYQKFIDASVAEYIAQTQVVEKFIVESIEFFNQLTAELNKSISDTVLAAIGVFLGSFLAALFSSEFNQLIFVIGTWSYVLYILVFPRWFTLTNLKERFDSISASIESRRARLEKTIPPDKVNEIDSGQIEKASGRFTGRLAFGKTILTCLAILAFVIGLVGIGAPMLIPRDDARVVDPQPVYLVTPPAPTAPTPDSPRSTRSSDSPLLPQSTQDNGP